MAPFSFTAFSDADRAAVFGLFQSNVPDYFQASEQADLAATLEAPDGPHWVMRRDGEVIGYGGFEIGTAYNRVVLTWGMVRNDLHRQGLGRALLAHRAAQAAQMTAGNTCWLVVDTIPAVAPFYERCGFERVESWPHGYRSGFDMVVLRMAFRSAQMQRLITANP